MTLAPAEYTSWQEARSELMIEGKRCARSLLSVAQTACLSPGVFPVAQAAHRAAAGRARERDGRRTAELRAEFDAREKAFEHDLDHTQRDVHLMIECSYSTPRPARPAPPRFRPLLMQPSLASTDFLSK